MTPPRLVVAAVAIAAGSIAVGAVSGGVPPVEQCAGLGQCQEAEHLNVYRLKYRPFSQEFVAQDTARDCFKKGDYDFDITPGLTAQDNFAPLVMKGGQQGTFSTNFLGVAGNEETGRVELDFLGCRMDADSQVVCPNLRAELTGNLLDFKCQRMRPGGFAIQTQNNPGMCLPGIPDDATCPDTVSWNQGTDTIVQVEILLECCPDCCQSIDGVPVDNDRRRRSLLQEETTSPGSDPIQFNCWTPEPPPTEIIIQGMIPPPITGFGLMTPPPIKLPPGGNLTSPGNVTATHLEFLVDDSLKQNVTFADKKKMLANVVGLKVVDFAYTDEFQDLFHPNVPVFNGAPPHWYKASYYRGILAESLAYKLPQALSKAEIQNLTEFSGGISGDGCCASLDMPMNQTEPLWYAKLDTIVTELVGAVQGLAVLNLDAKGLVGLAKAGGGGGGPVSLGMFIGAVLEVFSKKGFGHPGAKKSLSAEDADATEAHLNALPDDVQTAAEETAASLSSAAAAADGVAAGVESELSARFEGAFESLHKAKAAAQAALEAAEAAANTQQARLAALAEETEARRQTLKELRSARDALVTRQSAMVRAVDERLSR